MPLDAVFERIESLLAPPIDLHAAKPPIRYPLALAVMRQARVWLCMTFALIALGLLVEYLRSHGHIARGNLPGPLYILAAGFACIWGFCLIVGWLGARELARIRQGNYLARWPSDDGGVHEDAIQHRRELVQLLFFIPLIALGVTGFILGGIGSYIKHDWMIVWNVGLGGVAIGLGLGLLFAVPAWFLVGIRVHIARKLPSETIFTETGFYQPGRFVPVMPRAPNDCEVALDHPDRHDSRTRLTFTLHQSRLLGPRYLIRIHTRIRFVIPVPAGREHEAMALVKHYRP